MSGHRSAFLLFAVLWATAGAPAVLAELQQDPDKSEVRLFLAAGFAMVEADDATNAVKIFRKVLTLDVGNRLAKYGISAAYIKMGRYKESVAILDTLTAQYPNDHILKNNAAWLYATASDPNFRDVKKAVNLAREALLQVPNDYHVWNTLAEAHYNRGDYERALAAAREAVKLARAQNATPESMALYEEQEKKCQVAVMAFTLLE